MPDPAAGQPPLPTTFEESLAELELIVVRLERGQETLDGSLRAFERGVRLLSQCRQALGQAENRIQQLVHLDETGEARLRPFAHQATLETPSARSQSPPRSAGTLEEAGSFVDSELVGSSPTRPRDTDRSNAAPRTAPVASKRQPPSLLPGNAAEDEPDISDDREEYLF